MIRGVINTAVGVAGFGAALVGVALVLSGSWLMRRCP